MSAPIGLSTDEREDGAGAPSSLVVDFGAGRLVGSAFARLGRSPWLVEASMADGVDDTPDVLARTIGSSLLDGTPLVLAFGGDGVGAASAVDWDEALHRPLARCFTFLRSLGPIVQAAGGECVAVLPTDAIVPDPVRAAASTLHRAVLGLFEALRAESAGSPMGVTIAFVEPGDDAATVARRLIDVLARRGMYSLPPSVDEAWLTARFAPMLAAAEATVCAPDFPLPPTPMGAVYQREIDETASTQVHRVRSPRLG